ncbi:MULTISPECIES: class I SAM-dependent methyltransferase [unclassified Meridianimarinicoccus]|uniref:class I SAM-dependent methyltransferase n=1 Tax=unclassified Meridianimarinicoccus TaxID=2923344 RepID=UPI00299F8749|nr:methyltransferase domain-containing protein [Fluviibacterium sp. MJW13]
MLTHVANRFDWFRRRGTIAPSSRFLVRRMLERLDFSQDMELLQLGFGTGVFTEGIVRRMTPRSTVTVFEIDERCRAFMVDDPRVTYVEASAERISDHFPGKRFDNIVSTLPFASLPRQVSLNVFSQIREHLGPNGKLLQFQYSLVSRNDLRDLFGTEPEIGFELRNLPPAFIYVVRNGAAPV